jgi:hypothetical protein
MNATNMHNYVCTTVHMLACCDMRVAMKSVLRNTDTDSKCVLSEGFTEIKIVFRTPYDIVL